MTDVLLLLYPLASVIVVLIILGVFYLLYVFKKWQSLVMEVDCPNRTNFVCGCGGDSFGRFSISGFEFCGCLSLEGEFLVLMSEGPVKFDRGCLNVEWVGVKWFRGGMSWVLLSDDNNAVYVTARDSVFDGRSREKTKKIYENIRDWLNNNKNK